VGSTPCLLYTILSVVFEARVTNLCDRDIATVVWATESIRHLWKQFRRTYLNGQRVSFPWLLMSQQGLCDLTNPFITCENSFTSCFCEGADSVFGDCLWVKRGCVGTQIHSSPVQGVSGAISEWAASQFSLTVYESKGAVGADESIRHMWKTFRGLLLSGQQLSFPRLFMSHQGCLGSRIHLPPVKAVSGAISEWEASQFSLTVYESTGAVGANESIRHMWKEFWGLLLSGQRLSFPRLFMSHQGLFGLPNPFATCESSFGGYIWMGSKSVFLDCLWANRGCVGWRIPSSPVKTVSGVVSVRARLSFWWLFMSQKGLCGQTNPFVAWESSFGGYIWMGNESVFLYCLWVNRGCGGWRIGSSHVKRISRAASEWATTQLS